MRISDWSSDVCSSDLEARHLCADHRFFDGFDRCQDIESFRFRALRNAFVVIVESGRRRGWRRNGSAVICRRCLLSAKEARSEEHTSVLQSLMRNSYAVFCLKKKNNIHKSIEKHQRDKIVIKDTQQKSLKWI